MAEKLRELKSLQDMRDEWLAAPDIEGVNKHHWIAKIDSAQYEYGRFWHQLDAKIGAIKTPSDFEE